MPSTISLTEKNSCCIQGTPLVPLLHLRNKDFYFQYLELIEAMGKCQCVSGKEQPPSPGAKPSQEVWGYPHRAGMVLPFHELWTLQAGA